MRNKGEERGRQEEGRQRKTGRGRVDRRNTVEKQGGEEQQRQGERRRQERRQRCREKHSRGEGKTREATRRVRREEGEQGEKGGEYRRGNWKVNGETWRNERGDRRGGEWENFFNMYVDELIVLKITEPRVVVAQQTNLTKAYTENGELFSEMQKLGAVMDGSHF